MVNVKQLRADLDRHIEELGDSQLPFDDYYYEVTNKINRATRAKRKVADAFDRDAREADHNEDIFFNNYHD